MYLINMLFYTVFVSFNRDVENMYLSIYLTIIYKSINQLKVFILDEFVTCERHFISYFKDT